MLSKIKRDHVKNLAFVASTCLECINETNGRVHKRRFWTVYNWGEMYWRDHVKIGRDQRFRCRSPAACLSGDTLLGRQGREAFPSKDSLFATHINVLCQVTS